MGLTTVMKVGEVRNCCLPTLKLEAFLLTVDWIWSFSYVLVRSSVVKV